MTRDEVIEECAMVAEGGRFLHDDAPDARFGKACADAIRALKKKNVAPQAQVNAGDRGNMKPSYSEDISAQAIGESRQAGCKTASAAPKERRHTIDTAIGMDDRRGAAPDQPKAEHETLYLNPSCRASFTTDTGWQCDCEHKHPRLCSANLSQPKAAGSWNPNETPEELALRLERVKEFVTECNAAPGALTREEVETWREEIMYAVDSMPTVRMENVQDLCDLALQSLDAVWDRGDAEKSLLLAFYRAWQRAEQAEAKLNAALDAVRDVAVWPMRDGPYDWSDKHAAIIAEADKERK